VVVSLCGCVGTLYLLPGHRLLCQILSLVTWLLLLAHVLNYLWAPLLYCLATLLLLGVFHITKLNVLVFLMF
jgi:hypothetical protein